MNDNPFHEKIIQLVENWKIEKLCNDYFAEQFLWKVKGSGQFSTTYTSKEEYFEKALNRLSRHIREGATISVLDSYSVRDTLILELEGQMTTISGQPYHNQYCWIIKTDKEKITSITAYLDTLLLERVINQEEATSSGSKQS